MWREHESNIINKITPSITFFYLNRKLDYKAGLELLGTEVAEKRG